LYDSGKFSKAQLAKIGVSPTQYARYRPNRGKKKPKAAPTSKLTPPILAAELTQGIDDFLFVPSQGSAVNHTNSSILVRKVGDVIYPDDFKKVLSYLSSRFSSSQYELFPPNGVLSAGESSIIVYVGYTRDARLRRTNSEGKFIPVLLSEISSALK
jgi:hypothetical protein